MYQGIYFNRQSGPDKYHYYIKDDKKGINCFQYFPTLYKLDPYGEHTTLFGDRASEYQGKYDKNDNTILEKDISKELVALRDFYYQTDNVPSTHNLLYLDIEMEIIGALNPVTIKQANAEITSISLIFNGEKTCFIVDKKGDIQSILEGKKIIISCKNEKDLLKLFLDKWEEIDPTIVCGWNSDYYDIPYLYYRIKKLLGKEVLRLSPIKKIDENLNNPESPITIGLVASLDYMLLLKKFIAKEEPSYKLADIGEKYAKIGKIEFNGSLNDLYRENKELFIDYNIRDVEILEALENKLQFINLAILISHICHTPYESIYFNTVLNEGAILTYLKRKGIVAPNKPTTTNPTIKDILIGDHVMHQRGTPTFEGIVHEINKDRVIIKTLSHQFISRDLRTIRKKDSYSGGYLLDPVPNLYFNLLDLDFTSLYPSLIKTINIGIETLVGSIVTDNNYHQEYSLEKLKLMDPLQEIEVQKLNKYTYELAKNNIQLGKLIKLIEDNKWSVSASGAFFRTDIKSISCEVLEDWFIQRENYRALKKKAGKNEDWENYKLYDLYQMAFKILQNALYGTYAINSWRFTDGYKICSAAITNSGQRLVKGSIDNINYLVEDFLSKDINELKEIFDL